jgi:DNA-binding beta-propeller fold protein YncE
VGARRDDRRMEPSLLFPPRPDGDKLAGRLRAAGVRPVFASVLTALAVLTLLVAAGTAWGASGGFERTWGKDVITGAPTIAEICTQAANCKSGIDGAFDLGGEFDVPQDVAVDSAGNSYVVDESNQRIQKFDPTGKFVLAWGKDVIALNQGTGYEICTVAENCQAGSVGGKGGEFDDPEGVAVDSSGNVYVSDSSNNRIQKFDSSGDFLLTWGKDVNVFGGSGFETCNAEALCIAGDPGGSGGELSGPGDIGVGPDGSVYSADFENRRIQKFNASGDFLRTWGKDVLTGAGTGYEVCTAAASCQAGQPGSLAGEFGEVRSVVADSAGVYVGDNVDHRIQEFDSSGTFLRTWGKDVRTDGGTGFEICAQAASCQSGSPGSLGGELREGEGIATDSAGAVYVSDAVNSRIQKFDSTGNFLRTWGRDVLVGGGTGFEICTVAEDCQAGSGGSLGGELGDAHGLDAGPGEKLWVAEAFNDRIQVFGDAVDPSSPPQSPPPPSTDNGFQTGTGTGTQGTNGTTVNSQCQPLRKKLKKAKTKAAKKNIRRKLRALGC